MSTQQIAPLPVCKAILLCKHVRKDDSGELSLTGLVGNFFLDQSLVAPPTELFCQLTDALGRYNVVVEIHDLERNEVVGRSEPTEFEAVDPLMSLDVVMPISGMKFQRTGLHDIVVFANDEEIDRKQFGVAYLEDVNCDGPNQ
jgi:hypothetical protein